SLEEQHSAQYTLVKMGSDSTGPAVVETGTILAIQKGGILGVPYGNMSMLPAKYQDETLNPPATAPSNSATSMGSKVCDVYGKGKSAADRRCHRPGLYYRRQQWQPAERRWLRAGQSGCPGRTGCAGSK